MRKGKPVADLPEAPSLLVDRAGVVMRANAAAAALAGTDDPDKLLGKRIDDVLVQGCGHLRFTLGEGDGVPVRAVRWRVPTTAMDAVLLTDISDLVRAQEALGEERRRSSRCAGGSSTT